MSQWKKVRIGDIFAIEKGSLQSSKNTDGEYDFITAAADWKTHNSYDHDCEAIVYAVAASGSLGRAHYVNGKFIASDLCFILTEKDKNKYPINFLFYQIVFEMLRDEIVSKTKTGTSKESINRGNFSNYEIPYFSIEFQLDNYQRFVDAKNQIKSLNEESEKQKEYLKQLRQNILQDAIEGKLTADWRKSHPLIKGNPDYDAEALFEKILKEKDSDKKQKKLPLITDEEKPFEIPKGWRWVRLGEISNKIEAGKSILCNERIPNDDEIGIVKTGVCSFGTFKENESKTCLSKNDWHDEYAIKKGDFLIGRANTLELVGSCVIVDNINKKLMLSDKILRIVFHNFVNSSFILYMMRSRFLRSQIEESSTGSSPTMKNISQESIKKYVLPLPPLKEQEEIVNKIESLLAKVTELENQIQERKTLSEKLAFGIIKEKLEG
jgi:type I restriction enzyme S subunit